MSTSSISVHTTSRDPSGNEEGTPDATIVRIRKEVFGVVEHSNATPGDPLKFLRRPQRAGEILSWIQQKQIAREVRWIERTSE